MTQGRILLLDCNLEDSSSQVFVKAIESHTPPQLTLERCRVSTSERYDWASQAERYSGIIISGSAAAIQSGPGWVQDLAKDLKRAKGVPTLGICFGHQVLAYAWGGVIAEDRLGYKIRGICEVELSLPESSTQPAAHQRLAPWLPHHWPTHTAPLQVLASHRDQVIQAPKGWYIWAHSEACPIQAMVAKDQPIITVQWHPEADRDFILDSPHPDWDDLVHGNEPPSIEILEGSQILSAFLHHIASA